MLDTSLKLNKALKENEIIKEYFLLKNKIENDNFLKNLILVIKETQKELNNNLKENKIEEVKTTKLTLELLKERFIGNPLVNNYIETKKEVYRLLEQVVTIIGE